MNVEIKIDTEKTIKAFEAAPQLLRREMVLAMKKATRNVAERARREHKFVSRGGALEGSIDHGNIGSDRPEGFVSAGGANAPYARAIHDGSGLFGPKGSKYLIEPKFRTVLRWVGAGAGGFRFAKRVMHPGVKPDPFLVNAAAKEGANIEQLFADAVENSLK